MSERQIKHVTNNTAAFITTPPNDEFQNGLQLQPGLNIWPSKYEAACRATERGAKKLEAFFARHTKRVPIYTGTGTTYGPQLTFLYEDLSNLPEGPEPPASLPANEKAALAIVAACSPKHVDALERWLLTAKGAVRSAILAKQREGQ
jgi:hypothetical protein